MSVLSNSSRDNCQDSRRGHRYWTSQKKCRLNIRWPEGHWEVSFVDTHEKMMAWVNKYAVECLIFDCEWSMVDGVGLIQFATLPSSGQVLVVDCTRVRLVHVKDLFQNLKMVGWATSNDVRHLQNKQPNIIDTNVIDLQLLSNISSNISLCEKMTEDDRNKIEAYQPLDKHGTPHTGAWSLDDMATCFLGHIAKIPLKKHPQWSNPNWRLYDRDIHYAANDVIGLAYIYDLLKYVYKSEDKKSEISNLAPNKSVELLF